MSSPGRYGWKPRTAASSCILTGMEGYDAAMWGVILEGKEGGQNIAKNMVIQYNIYLFRAFV